MSVIPAHRLCPSIRLLTTKDSNLPVFCWTVNIVGKRCEQDGRPQPGDREALTAFKCAGADGILNDFAARAAHCLESNNSPHRNIQ